MVDSVDTRWSERAIGIQGYGAKDENPQTWLRSDTRSTADNEAALQIPTMTEAQMRADMEALMARLIQTEQALMDTRQQLAFLPEVTAPLADNALTFTGEHKHWPEWSFQFTGCMGSANPKSIEALRWAAMEEDKITAAAVVKQSFEEHNPQLYLVLALLLQRKCTGDTEEHGSQQWT